MNEATVEDTIMHGGKSGKSLKEATNNEIMPYRSRYLLTDIA